MTLRSTSSYYRTACIVDLHRLVAPRIVYTMERKASLKIYDLSNGLASALSLQLLGKQVCPHNATGLLCMQASMLVCE
jgi:hypothetical protein